MKKILLIPFLFYLCACASDLPPVRTAEQMIQQHGLEKKIIQTDTFNLFTSYKNKKTETVRIYIEGDGFAWENRYRPSEDPTPHNPIGLHLFLNDQSPKTTLYIARPCQYIKSMHCEPRHWTDERFSLEIVKTINEAIEIYKKNIGFKHVELIGFSGGAAISLLLSTQRDDITQITTVAGNLDTEAWIAHHGVSPLKGFMNPVKYQKYYRDIPQVHYVGEADEIIPCSLTEEFSKNLKHSKIIKIKNKTHLDWHNFTVEYD